MKQCPSQQQRWYDPGPSFCCVVSQCLLHNSVDRDKVVAKLKSVGIGTSVHYACPVPLLGFYRNKYGLDHKSFASAIEYGKRVISLPVHSKISESDVSFISNSLRTVIEGELNETDIL